MAINQEHSDQTSLARLAAGGDRAAQREVNTLVHPVIEFQTDRFCKRFCRNNAYLYRCSLSRPIGSPPADASLCEWGNASYGWMLDDLCKPGRLKKFEARNQASLFDYLYTIANSLPFYERWKDWRFGRRQQVPLYIREIDEQAPKIFYAMRNNQLLENVAAQLGMTLPQAEALASGIVLELTRRHRLYLLDPPHDISLTGSDGDVEDEAASHQKDIAFDDDTVDRQDQGHQLNEAWSRLDATEQFVVEALVIDEQDANEVLAALQALDISIKPGVDAADTDRQQLYYFKRRALAKLGDLLDE